MQNSYWTQKKPFGTRLTGWVHYSNKNPLHSSVMDLARQISAGASQKVPSVDQFSPFQACGEEYPASCHLFDDIQEVLRYLESDEHLMRPKFDSYRTALTKLIPNDMHASPHGTEWFSPDGRFLFIHKYGTVRYDAPSFVDGDGVVKEAYPWETKMRNLNYTHPMYVDIEFKVYENAAFVPYLDGLEDNTTYASECKSRQSHCAGCFEILNNHTIEFHKRRQQKNGHFYVVRNPETGSPDGWILRRCQHFLNYQLRDVFTMMRSFNCRSKLDPSFANESPLDPGGYFISNGHPRFLINMWMRRLNFPHIKMSWSKKAVTGHHNYECEFRTGHGDLGIIANTLHIFIAGRQLQKLKKKREAITNQERRVDPWIHDRFYRRVDEHYYMLKHSESLRANEHDDGDTGSGNARPPCNNAEGEGGGERASSPTIPSPSCSSGYISDPTLHWQQMQRDGDIESMHVASPPLVVTKQNCLQFDEFLSLDDNPSIEIGVSGISSDFRFTLVGILFLFGLNSREEMIDMLSEGVYDGLFREALIRCIVTQPCQQIVLEPEQKERLRQAVDKQRKTGVCSGSHFLTTRHGSLSNASSIETTEEYLKHFHSLDGWTRLEMVALFGRYALVNLDPDLTIPTLIHKLNHEFLGVIGTGDSANAHRHKCFMLCTFIQKLVLANLEIIRVGDEDHLMNKVIRNDGTLLAEIFHQANTNDMKQFRKVINKKFSDLPVRDLFLASDHKLDIWSAFHEMNEWIRASSDNDKEYFANLRKKDRRAEKLKRATAASKSIEWVLQTDDGNERKSPKTSSSSKVTTPADVAEVKSSIRLSPNGLPVLVMTEIIKSCFKRNIMKSAIDTGNWTTSKQGSVPPGQTGVSQLHTPSNKVASIGNMRKTKIPLPDESKSKEPREFRNGHAGMICGPQTPDDVNLGLVMHLAMQTHERIGYSQHSLETIVLSAVQWLPCRRHVVSLKVNGDHDGSVLYAQRVECPECQFEPLIIPLMQSTPEQRHLGVKVKCNNLLIGITMKPLTTLRFLKKCRRQQTLPRDVGISWVGGPKSGLVGQDHSGVLPSQPPPSPPPPPSPAPAPSDLYSLDGTLLVKEDNNIFETLGIPTTQHYPLASPDLHYINVAGDGGVPLRPAFTVRHLWKFPILCAEYKHRSMTLPHDVYTVRDFWNALFLHGVIEWLESEELDSCRVADSIYELLSTRDELVHRRCSEDENLGTSTELIDRHHWLLNASRYNHRPSLSKNPEDMNVNDDWMDRICRRMHWMSSSSAQKCTTNDSQANHILLRALQGGDMDQLLKSESHSSLDPCRHWDRFDPWHASRRYWHSKDLIDRYASLVHLHPHCYTHVNIHPKLLFGVAMSTSTNPDQTHAARNQFYAAMSSQATAGEFLNESYRKQTLIHTMIEPTAPIVGSHAYSGLFPYNIGHGGRDLNMMLVSDPDTAEDATKCSLFPREMGHMRSWAKRTFTVTLKSGKDADRFARPDPFTCLSRKNSNYDTIMENGLPCPGTQINHGDALVGRVMHTESVLPPHLSGRDPLTGEMSRKTGPSPDSKPILPRQHLMDEMISKMTVDFYEQKALDSYYLEGDELRTLDAPVVRTSNNTSTLMLAAAPESLQNEVESANHMPKMFKIDRFDDLTLDMLREMTDMPGGISGNPQITALFRKLGQKKPATSVLLHAVAKSTIQKMYATRDNSVVSNIKESASVHQITLTKNLEGHPMVHVSLHSHRASEFGDKFSSRHGQKGVVANYLVAASMPYSICPKTGRFNPCDFLMNPHAVPSRMTVNMLTEMNKTNEHLRSKVGRADPAMGVPFENSKVDERRKSMYQQGYHPAGRFRAFAGNTGIAYEQLINTGPIEMCRLKHHAADKASCRPLGPVSILTHQPSQGIQNSGGQKNGVMELMVQVAHGGSQFVNTTMNVQSDPFRFLCCLVCGIPAEAVSLTAVRNQSMPLVSSVGAYCRACDSFGVVFLVEMPYATFLVLNEMRAQNTPWRLQFAQSELHRRLGVELGNYAHQMANNWIPKETLDDQVLHYRWLLPQEMICSIPKRYQKGNQTVSPTTAVWDGVDDDAEEGKECGEEEQQQQQLDTPLKSAESRHPHCLYVSKKKNRYTCDLLGRDEIPKNIVIPWNLSLNWTPEYLSTVLEERLDRPRCWIEFKSRPRSLVSQAVLERWVCVAPLAHKPASQMMDDDVVPYDPTEDCVKHRCGEEEREDEKDKQTPTLSLTKSGRRSTNDTGAEAGARLLDENIMGTSNDWDEMMELLTQYQNAAPITHNSQRTILHPMDTEGTAELLVALQNVDGLLTRDGGGDHGHGAVGNLQNVNTNREYDPDGDAFMQFGEYDPENDDFMRQFNNDTHHHHHHHHHDKQSTGAISNANAHLPKTTLHAMNPKPPKRVLDDLKSNLKMPENRGARKRSRTGSDLLETVYPSHHRPTKRSRRR